MWTYLEGQGRSDTGSAAFDSCAVTYFPVSMLDRDGQHMGVVTKALEKEVPPSSMMRRVLFMACMEPAADTWFNTGVTSCFTDMTLI